MAQSYQQFSPLSALSYVQQQGEMGRERGKENRLNQLASLAYSAPADQRDSILSQAASVDAGAAQGIEKQMAYSDDRRNTSMVNMARLLTKAPEQARAGLYRSMVPTLSRFGLSDLPQDYNDQTAPTIMQAAQSLVQAYQGGAGSGVQSTYVDEGGNRVAIMRDGSTQVLGRNDAGANQQTLTIDVNGAPTQVTFDRRTGRYTNAALGGQPATAQPASGMQMVGGQQVFIDPSLPDSVRSGLLQSLQAGQEPQVMAVAAPTGVPLVGRRKEDEAAATERAKLQAQQDFLPTELGMRTQADIAKSRGIEQAKSEQERASNERAKTAQLNNVDRGLARIDEALKSLSGRLVDTGPIDGRLMVSTPQGQELEAAVGAIQNDMLALTRVPGIGSQSDLEAKIANLKYPSIYNHPSVNAANVQQLKAFMGDLRNQISGSAQPGRTVVRTGTSNGRKVIQYSDGSVEYGN